MTQQTRRKFFKSTVLSGAGALAIPNLLPSHIWAAEARPNSKLTMGFIGMGKQSRGLLGTFLGNDTRVVAVCDVDPTRREDAKRKVDTHYGEPAGSAGCAAYNDFLEIIHRKDIDAVCIATPLTAHDAHFAGVVFVGHRIVKDEIAVWRSLHLCAHVFPDQMRRNALARQIAIDLIVTELLRMSGKVGQRVVDLAAQQILTVIQAGDRSGFGFHGQQPYCRHRSLSTTQLSLRKS